MVANLDGDATRLRSLNHADYRRWLEEEDFGVSDLWLRVRLKANLLIFNHKKSDFLVV